MGPLYYSTVQRCIDEDTIICSYEEDELVSFLLWKRYKTSSGVLLDKMAVRESKTGNGLGLMMLDKLKEIAKKEGRSIKLRVAKVNELGIKFYLNNGFRYLPEEEKDIVFTMIFDEGLL